MLAILFACTSFVIERVARRLQPVEHRLRAQARPGVVANATDADREVELRHFDLSCAAPVVVLDIDEPHAGDASARFVPYTRERNRALVAESLAQSIRVSDAIVERMVTLPDSDRCAAAGN